MARVVTEVKGYELALDRLYDAERHLWVEVVSPGRVRIGMDPLGVETAGDLVLIALEAPGGLIARGDSFGTIEAAKYVGPLSSPVSGQVMMRNENAMDDPGLVMRDPLGAGWLVEIELSRPEELGGLLAGDRIVPWFESKVEEYVLKGMLAE